MNILSYRGPGMAGGVSSALALLWREHEGDATWWYLCDNNLQAAEQLDESPRSLLGLPKSVVDGHYRYCNEFLWPLMHDLPQYARYRADDHKMYMVANRMIARGVLSDHAANQVMPVFVQDYQLAILPELLDKHNMRSLVFWHIPWPRNVAAEHVRPLVQIAKGLINSELLGFHTSEYANNFLNFVKQHIPGLSVDFESGTISRAVMGGGASSFLFFGESSSSFARPRVTAVVKAPLGIDTTFWNSSARIPQIRLRGPAFKWLNSATPFVLSVDRADYTKGVIERFQAINRYFERNPDMIGKLNFVQICGRTRPGLSAFDGYWTRCQHEAAVLQKKWQTAGWSPLIWVDQPCAASELAYIYREAAVMLVNPVRDGLNLTAKEFVASQVRQPGVLALSTGAGAWHELSQGAVSVTPADCDQVAASIEMSLQMSYSERLERLSLMKENIEDNTLANWWTRIADRVALVRERLGDHDDELFSAVPG